MSFQPCFLIEIGFIDHPGDRFKMLDATLRWMACDAIAKAIT
jgi:N-acetylmuramoyl-L-alanine amidase